MVLPQKHQKLNLNTMENNVLSPITTKHINRIHDFLGDCENLKREIFHGAPAEEIAESPVFVTLLKLRAELLEYANSLVLFDLESFIKDR